MKLVNTPNVTRRSFVASVGAATVLPPAAALVAERADAAPPAPPAPHESAAAPAEPRQSVYLFFNVAEARFIEAACERLIPADEAGAGGAPPAARNPRSSETSRWNAGKDLSFVPLRPERVAEVRYDHMEGRRFRHTTQFVRWRPDRDPRSCTYDQLEEPVKYDLAEILGGPAG